MQPGRGKENNENQKKKLNKKKKKKEKKKTETRISNSLTYLQKISDVIRPRHNVSRYLII
ncbi:hypothetical protein I7I53_12181 [Histoplasma capsulatum var. duboisii H88]|uniref:Uncharacterized protein n=1 Tax=Ajellomyces capsulatus (strain H88) TaxID=544711 RepID=A0A8A1M102_AJEC8|nr:hypothetical protein I7I53_12181 [Histoplasma capsulatum var. duboisii H88]